MSRFNLGSERTLQAAISALEYVGYTGAANFLKATFLDPQREEQANWALKDFFGIPKQVLDAEREKVLAQAESPTPIQTQTEPRKPVTPKK